MNNSVASPGALLDTCALIWIANGEDLRPGADTGIMAATREKGLFISPVSAWEIGLLSRPRLRAAYQFLPDPVTWLANFMARPAILSAPLTPEIAIAASWLPDPLHRDPADRLLIATARHLGVPIVTRDAKIIDYAAAGHVAVIPC